MSDWLAICILGYIYVDKYEVYNQFRRWNFYYEGEFTKAMAEKKWKKIEFLEWLR